MFKCNFTPFISLLLFVLGFFFTLEAQNLVSVTGKVLNEEQGKPLEFVAIKLHTLSDSALVKGAFTNSDGKFEITAAPGKYYIKFSHARYDDIFSDELEIKPSQANLHLGTLRMQLTKTQNVKEVVVRGQKEVMEAGIDKKVYNVAEDLNVNGGTANDILNRLPSVEVDQDGGVLLRGQGGVTILIDGRQVR